MYRERSIREVSTREVRGGLRRGLNLNIDINRLVPVVKRVALGMAILTGIGQLGVYENTNNVERSVVEANEGAYYAEPIVKVETLELLNPIEPVGQRTKFRGDIYGLNFVDRLTPEAREYLTSAYEQAMMASKGTKMENDPFIVLALSVIENPVVDSGVLRVPLVDGKILAECSNYSEAVARSHDRTTDVDGYATVGPLQIARNWMRVEELGDSTNWYDSARMFYENATNYHDDLLDYAINSDVVLTDEVMVTLYTMQHNMGNIGDWGSQDVLGETGKSFIPYRNKKAVYEWAEVFGDSEVQSYIQAKAKEYGDHYKSTGLYTNQGITWREVAEVGGYDTNKVLLGDENWRPKYQVNFWFNYYQLKYLFGIEGSYNVALNFR